MNEERGRAQVSEHELAALRDAAVSAARGARERLARALTALQEAGAPSPDIGNAPVVLARVIGMLFGVEARDAKGVMETIRRAMEILREVLPALQGTWWKDPALDTATAAVARTMALLHPPERELTHVIEEGGRPYSLESEDDVDIEVGDDDDGPEISIEAEEPDEPEAPAPPPEPSNKVIVSDELFAPPPPPSPPEPDAEAIPLAPQKRRARRINLSADIGLHSDTNFFSGFAGDISAGGIFVATYNVLPIGTEITISFVLPGGHQVTVAGRVRWVREHEDKEHDTTPGMGIQFVKLSEADRKAIVRFMEQRAPLFWED